MTLCFLSSPAARSFAGMPDHHCPANKTQSGSMQSQQACLRRGHVFWCSRGMGRRGTRRTRKDEVENDRIRMAGRRRTPSCLPGEHAHAAISHRTRRATSSTRPRRPPPPSLAPLPPFSPIDPAHAPAQNGQHGGQISDLPRRATRDTPVRGRSIVACCRPPRMRAYDSVVAPRREIRTIQCAE